MWLVLEEASYTFILLTAAINTNVTSAFPVIRVVIDIVTGEATTSPLMSNIQSLQCNCILYAKNNFYWKDSLMENLFLSQLFWWVLGPWSETEMKIVMSISCQLIGFEYLLTESL